MGICVSLFCYSAIQPSRLRCNVLRLGRIALQTQKIVSELTAQGGAPGATASATLTFLSSKEDEHIKHYNCRKLYGGLRKLEFKSATFEIGVKMA